MLRTMLVALATLPALSMYAQSGPAVTSRYPFIPKPLADAAEVALARSAAPPEVSDSADVYAVREGKVLKLHAGSSGSACMVSRDLHEGSAYPICFNPEGARTAMQRELLQNRLRSLGVAEDSVDRVVERQLSDGTLKAPSRLALAYMMSPQQLLFSSPKASGVRVGAWYPHLMIFAPHTSDTDVGLARTDAGAGVIQVGEPGTHHMEIVVKVPRWSNGSVSP